MAFFRRTPKTQEAPQEERGLYPWGNAYAAPSMYGLAPGDAGVGVNTTSALRNVAVWACQRVLVSTISMLPVDVIRTEGAHRLTVPAPMMVRNPSARVSRRGWVAQNIRSLVGSGNIYGRVVATDSLARPTQIETIHPDGVTWQTKNGEEIPYLNGVAQTLWPVGDFWHVPASQFLMPGSRVAMNPIDYARTSIGTGLAAEQFGANFFRDGLNPSAIVKVNAQIDATQAAAIKQAIMNMARNNREPAVFGADIDKVEPWMAKLTDSQFIELLQFEVLQACRVYGVPPSMVYAAVTGQNITYSNIGQSDMQYLKYGVMPWIVDLEDAWSDLIAMPHTVKFNVDAILRMDALERANLAKTRLEAKTTTINAVRALEDEEPFPDEIYDQPGTPGGQETLGQLMRGLTPAVGVYVTPDEAREMANEAGASLTIPGPTELGPTQQTLPLTTP